MMEALWNGSLQKTAQCSYHLPGTDSEILSSSLLSQWSHGRIIRVGRKSGRGAAKSLSKKEDAINSKVFIGNLSFETTQGELQTIFAEVGEILDVFMPTDRASGRPRGFAFIEFGDGSSAAKAIERFDGFNLNKRDIRVSEAQERQRPSFESGPPGGRPPGPGPRGAKPKGSRRNIRGKKRGF